LKKNQASRLCSFWLLIVFFIIPFLVMTSEKCTAKSLDTPVKYIPSEENLDIRRREGGENSVSRGVSRGLSRGASRGLSRGVSRGLSRGASRGLSRGASRGLSRGASRGLSRGASRGVSRGASRGLSRGASRGASRGVSRAEITEPKDFSIPDFMAPIVCEHTGLSLSPQPVLWWYISGPWPGNIEFTINKPRAPEPEFQIEFPGPEKPGIYPVNLADYGVVLEPGIEYEWFVAIIVDPDERSGDFLASATVKYIKISEDVLSEIQSSDYEKYYVYATRGYWYDAIEILNRTVYNEPLNKRIRKERMELLKQVNLPKVVLYEQKLLNEK
jgi:hypothetical protein